jgi:diguanylate cyclase (GGDEF)-like protein
MKFEDLVPMGRRSLILTTNLVVVALIAVLAGLRYVVMGLDYYPLAATFVVSGGLANAVYILRNGSLDAAAWVLIGLLLGGLFYGGLNTGGFSGPVVMLAPLIPIYSMLLINNRIAWVSLLLVCLVLGALFLMDYNGYTPQNPNTQAQILVGRFITLFSLCLASTLVVWSFARISRGLLVEIERQSVTDYLTGIFNRRGIEAILLSEVGRARRTDSWLSVIITDVDHFKQYNDLNGHQAGDLCLIKVAQIIEASSVRTADVAGRFGGEEFIVILPGTDRDGATKVAENIRTRVLTENIPYGPGNPAPVSLTFGVISARGHAIDSVEQLIRHADAALYRGKDQGRNRAVSVVLGTPDKQTVPRHAAL